MRTSWIDGDGAETVVATVQQERTPRRAPTTRLRYAGAAAVAVLWVCVLGGMYRTGLNLFEDRPISYLGTDPGSALLFRGGLVVAAVLMTGFAWFVFRWFPASPGFLAVFLIGLVGQVVAAVALLSGPGASPAVHNAGGLVLGASLPVFMWRFAAGVPSDHAMRRRRFESYGLFWLEVAACAAGLVLSARGYAPIAEIVPALAFHLWIAVITLWSTAQPPAQALTRSAAGAE